MRELCAAVWRERVKVTGILRNSKHFCGGATRAECCGFVTARAGVPGSANNVVAGGESVGGSAKIFVAALADP